MIVPDTNDAYAIFLHTRSAVTAARYPRRLDYTIEVSGTEGGETRANHYKGRYDTTNDAIRVFPISDEELAGTAPHPHDFDFNRIIVQGVSVPIGRPSDPDLLGGSPILDPVYSFGLRFKRATDIAAPDGDSSDSLPVIAVVSNNAPDYNVKLLGEESLNDEQTFHLELKPLRKPKKYRLRELWIGATDFLPRQAIVAGNFTVAPLVDIPWKVSFKVVDGIPYISSERAQATLYLSHHHVVHDAEVDFQDIQESYGDFIDAPLVAPDVTPTSLLEP